MGFYFLVVFSQPRTIIIVIIEIFSTLIKVQVFQRTHVMLSDSCYPLHAEYVEVHAELIPVHWYTQNKLTDWVLRSTVAPLYTLMLGCRLLRPTCSSVAPLDIEPAFPGLCMSVQAEMCVGVCS